MTTTNNTVSNAIAKRDNSPSAMVGQYESDFATVLPSHIKAATYVRLAQGVLRRDKNLARLAQQNPASLMQALLECARLGHEPGTEAFYLVPMGNEIEGWEGYRGTIERMFRAGAISTVKAEVVHANDRFDYRPGSMDRPDHDVDWFGDRGPVIGAYAYAVFHNGATSRVVVLNRAYLDKVRKESKGSDKSSSPWQKWEESMVLKTVLKRLEPFVPTSAEYRESVVRDAAELAKARAEATTTAPEAPADLPPPGVDPDTGVIDAEVIDDYEPTRDA